MLRKQNNYNLYDHETCLKSYPQQPTKHQRCNTQQTIPFKFCQNPMKLVYQTMYPQYRSNTVITTRAFTQPELPLLKLSLESCSNTIKPGPYQLRSKSTQGQQVMMPLAYHETLLAVQSTLKHNACTGCQTINILPKMCLSNKF